MANAITDAKSLGWHTINLNKNTGFKGAVQLYKTSTGADVALCFNMHEAFIVSDEAGLFTAQDLVSGIVNSKEFDVTLTGEIDGAHLVAWEVEDAEGPTGVVEFDEERLTELDINDFSVKESITSRILTLSKLDSLKDIPLF